MNLKQTFQKQGGIKLIEQYAGAGVLGTAINQFLVLGKSRTALEILRLSTQLKVKEKLSKKYQSKIIEFEQQFKSDYSIERKKCIWMFWLQGMGNAPEIVQKCFQSINDNITDRDIILLTEDNYRQYVTFPNYIQSKIDKGIIKTTHMSDLLRLELLTTYGGTWIDSTVYCSSPEIPDYMLDSDLFLFQCLKPGRDGHTNIISNWFITSEPNNKLLFLTKMLLYDYWNHHDDLMDYFIFHEFFSIVIEKYPTEWSKVVPFPNSVPHILLLRLFEPYNEEIWTAIKKQTPFHKLTYKYNPSQEYSAETYFNVLIRNNIGK